MDKTKLAIVALALSGLALGGCANGMGGDDTMEPAAGPTMSDDEAGMSPSEPGGMMDSDDEQDAGDVGGGGAGAGTQ